MQKQIYHKTKSCKQAEHERTMYKLTALKSKKNQSNPVNITPQPTLK